MQHLYLYKYASKNHLIAWRKIHKNKLHRMKRKLKDPQCWDSTRGMERKLEVHQIWDSTQGPFTLEAIHGDDCNVTFWSHPNVVFIIPTKDVYDPKKAWPIVVNSKFHKGDIVHSSVDGEVVICYVYANGNYGVTYTKQSEASKEQPWLVHEKELSQTMMRRKKTKKIKMGKMDNAIADSLCLLWSECTFAVLLQHAKK